LSWTSAKKFRDLLICSAIALNYSVQEAIDEAKSKPFFIASSPIFPVPRVIINITNLRTPVPNANNVFKAVLAHSFLLRAHA